MTHPKHRDVTVKKVGVQKTTEAQTETNTSLGAVVASTHHPSTTWLHNSFKPVVQLSLATNQPTPATNKQARQSVGSRAVVTPAFRV
jgi:hypothetical protein